MAVGSDNILLVSGRSGRYSRELEDLGLIPRVIHTYRRKIVVVVCGDNPNALIAELTRDGRTEACDNLDPLCVRHGSVDQHFDWVGCVATGL